MWILIIFTFQVGGGGSMALTHAEFNSQQACEVAGTKAEKEFSTFGIRSATHVCVDRGSAYR
jgi:hypothetical protein